MSHSPLRWSVLILFWVGLLWTSNCGSHEESCQEAKDCLAPKVCTAGQCVLPQEKKTQEPRPPEQTAERAKEQTSEVPSDSGLQPEPDVEKEPARELSTEPAQEASVEPTLESKREEEPTRDALPPETAAEVTPGKPCQQAKECPANQYCVKGRCNPQAECLRDSDCTQAPLTTCLVGYCTLNQPKCQTTGQCVPGTACHQGYCVPAPIPKSCKDNPDCPGNYVCRSGACTPIGQAPRTCQSDSDCRTWEKCFAKICQRKCTSNKQCPGVSLPSCQAGICINPNLPPGTCNADSDCMPRQYCSGNTCVTCKAPPECKADKDCKTGLVCRNGQCGKLCQNDAECRGGFQICSQRFCRGDGFHPVGCPEDQEICDLVIDKIQCMPNKRIEVTVKNIGIGPAVGRFYLCWEQKGSKRGCNGAIIMNYGAGGNVIGPQQTRKVMVSWPIKQGDILAVDRPNLILEASDTNNIKAIQSPCP